MYFNTHHIKIKYMHHNLINNVQIIFMLIVMKRYHIILKIKINACLQNMSIIIQLKMIHIITKFNVLKLIDIIQHNKHHMNVSNNVHLI